MKTKVNLLKDKESIAGYMAVEKMSLHHDGEREVYHAFNVQNGEEVALTVFNLRCKRYDVDGTSRKHYPDFIEEVRFLDSVGKGMPVFVPILDAGIVRTKGKRLGFMAQPWYREDTLTTEIRRQGVISKDDMLKIMKSLCEAVVAIRTFTRGGGHYGITTDNVLLCYEHDELKSVKLIGLTNIGTSYNGYLPFPTSDLYGRFHPAESFKGIMNHLTDIYSLGMVMGIMLGGIDIYSLQREDSSVIDIGCSTIDLTNIDNSNVIPARYREYVADTLSKRLSAPLRLMWLKATNPIPSNRFQLVEKFQQLLEKISDIIVSTHEERLPFGGLHADCLKEKIGADSSIQIVETEGIGSTTKPKDDISYRQSPATRRGLDAVAGMDDLKKLFRRNFVQIVQNPKIAKAYGITPCNCTLLYGPQGCGKTYIAEKAAEESGLKYRVINPSDLGSIFVHGAQGKIAEAFQEAIKNAPMILIFDEFDAIAPKRDSEVNPHQAGEVNELLCQLNSCADKGVYVLATTNRPDMIDSAIMRTGRVDEMFYVPFPDLKARHDLLAMELEKRPCADDIDLDALANATENYTGSDLAFIVKECARRCFDETLAQGLKNPLPLTQASILDVIKTMTPSVSPAEIKSYQELRKRMEKRGEKKNRPTVGFLTLN